MRMSRSFAAEGKAASRRSDAPPLARVGADGKTEHYLALSQGRRDAKALL